MAGYRERISEAPRLQSFLLSALPTGRYVTKPASEFADGGSTVEEFVIQEHGLVCVGKEVSFTGEPEGVDLNESAVEDCSLLFTLRHPNVIQYLGLWSHGGSRLPTVVMEYVPHSLHQLLQVVVDVALPVKHSILTDVARGLTYLHSLSPPVIHGKLTPSNVLLTAAMMAKISDVGKRLHTNLPSYLQSPGPDGCPYLPLEVAPGLCSTAIDVYSFGKLILHTILQELPDPTNPLFLNDSRILGSFAQGQSQSIEQLSQVSGGPGDPPHPVERLVDQCLQSEPGKRPSAGEVLALLTEGWSEVKCSYEELIKMKLAVTKTLMEQSLIHTFQVFPDSRTTSGTGILDITAESSFDVEPLDGTLMEQSGVDGSDDGGFQLVFEEDLTETTNTAINALCVNITEITEAAAPMSTTNTTDATAPVSTTDTTDTVAPVSTTDTTEAAVPMEAEVTDREGGTKPVAKAAKAAKTPKKTHQCTFCNAIFNKASNLKRHVQNHTGEKPYKCEVCQAGFPSPSAMKRHVVIHTGDKQYKCDICQAKFAQSVQLKEHIRKHTGEKPFQCKMYMCDARFGRSSDLKRHMLTHTGVKPYQCNICDAKFSQSVHLKQHVRTHTGEKPFQCDICDARFARSTHLNRHKLTHGSSTDKPLSCQFCNLRFTRASALRHHVATHTGHSPASASTGHLVLNSPDLSL